MRDLEDRRDLADLVLPEVGRLAGTGDEWVPYRLLDADGGVVVPVAEYLVSDLANNHLAVGLAELPAASHFEGSSADRYRTHVPMLRW